jgi:histidinol dehydrogenase
LTLLDLRGVPADGLSARLPRLPPPASRSEAVAEILAEVRAGGDAALRELTKRYDGVEVTELRVPAEVVLGAPAHVGDDVLRALHEAWERIVGYHRHEQHPRGDYVSAGVRVRHLVRAVDRAGLYAPGGRAKYPSTVLMAAAPAVVAGVGTLVLCVPPGTDGEIALETLAAAAVAGVDEVYRVGGAQAIAAMAFGSESIAPVDVVAGPGNSYVAEAKRQVSGLVGVPSAFTGPSEVVVVADDTTPVEYAAVDLVVQAEHGPDGLAWLVTWSPELTRAVTAEVERLVAASPRRAELEATLGSGGYAVVVDGPGEALAVANAVAPEHLELLVPDAESLLGGVRRAGAVFLGPGVPASVGDYLAGPNHILPTARTARFASALRVDDFQTHVHAVALDPGALEMLAPHAIALAEAEGLPAHAQSLRRRLDDGTAEPAPERGRP